MVIILSTQQNERVGRKSDWAKITSSLWLKFRTLPETFNRAILAFSVYPWEKLLGW